MPKHPKIKILKYIISRKGLIATKDVQAKIDKAKQAIINGKVRAWKEEWYRKHKIGFSWNDPLDRAPEPPEEDIQVRAWFIAEWDNGFAVFDLEEVEKLPKRNREKIFKLSNLI